jgi:cytoskeletal protein RodZ
MMDYRGVSYDGEYFMKFSYVSIMAVMLVVIVVAVAGCASTSPSTSNQANGAPSSGTTSSGAGSSSTPQVGSTMSASSVFGSSYNWIEYQTSTTSGGKQMTMDMKYERSTGDYQGTPAVHVKMTMTSSTGGTNGVFDYYYDTAMDKLLGGTMTMTVNGKTMTIDIPAEQLTQAQATNFHSGTLTFAGVEPVSVPAGTYPIASKYTESTNGTDVTFWSAPGVPVPVKITASSSSGSSTSELVGWG